jgi:hypothetical protein
MITLKKINTPQDTKLISTLEEMKLMNTVAFEEMIIEPKKREQKPAVAKTRKKKQRPDQQPKNTPATGGDRKEIAPAPDAKLNEE